MRCQITNRRSRHCPHHHCCSHHSPCHHSRHYHQCRRRSPSQWCHHRRSGVTRQVPSQKIPPLMRSRHHRHHCSHRMLIASSTSQWTPLLPRRTYACSFEAIGQLHRIESYRLQLSAIQFLWSHRGPFERGARDSSVKRRDA
jgi:hypothetical protein